MHGGGERWWLCHERRGKERRGEERRGEKREEKTRGDVGAAMRAVVAARRWSLGARNAKKKKKKVYCLARGPPGREAPCGRTVRTPLAAALYIVICFTLLLQRSLIDEWLTSPT